MIYEKQHIRIGKIIVIIIVINFLLSADTSHSQIKSPREIMKFFLVPNKTELLPLEPLWAMALWTNPTDQKVEILVSLELLTEWRQDSGDWLLYHPDNELVRLPPAPRLVTFQPREVRRLSTYLDFDQSLPDGHAFAKPGRVQIRAGIAEMASEPVDLTVHEPQGREAQAYEMLKQSPLRHYLNAKGIIESRYPSDHATSVALEAFIQQFPTTTYRVHAQFTLAIMWAIGVDEQIDLSKAQSLLTQLTTHSDPTVIAKAFLYLGLIALDKENFETARQHLLQVLQGQPDPYVKVFAEGVIERLPSQ